MTEPSPAQTSGQPDAHVVRSKQAKVPGIIMDFLDRATVGAAGTRDKDMIPHQHRISGWRVEPDGCAMTCFVAESFSKHLISSLEDNGQFAVTIEEIGPHETYQFKGRYVSSHPCGEEDLALYRQVRDRFAKAVAAKFGAPEELSSAFVIEPNVAVTFEIDEIFLQTPGPGAGRRLSPPEEK